MMLRKLLIVLLGCMMMLLANNLFAQSIDEIMKEGERLETNLQEKKALVKYEELLRVQPNDAKTLYKCSELSARIGAREKNEQTRIQFYSQAVNYANKLLKIQPNWDHSYVAASIALGKLALIKSGKEKITYVKEIRIYAEKALKINPGNYKAWHVLGKWHYEVANLNFFEKSMLKLFYGGLPEASFKQAIQAYDKASKLHDIFMLNELELAKALYANDQEKQAIQWLRHLQTLPIKTEDDPIILKEAKQLLKDWE